jgi:DNA repair exonuclease SbcCD nuclease subunit
MQLRIAQISDIHIDFNATRLGAPKIVQGVNVIHQERMERLAEMIHFCIESTVDSIILSGDIHNRPRPVAQEYSDLYKILDTIPDSIPVYVIPGNHDEVSSRGSPLLPLANRRRNIHVMFEPQFHVLKSICFLFAPWGTPFEQIQELMNQRKELHKVLVYHVGVTGVDNMNWGEVNDEPGTVHIDQLKSLELNGVMLGHHHNQTELARNIWYAGSPECFNFGERDHTKGFLLWNFSKTPNGMIDTRVTPCKTRYFKFRSVPFTSILSSSPDEFTDQYIRIDGEVTTQQRSDVVSKVNQLDGCLGVKYNLKIITEKNKSHHIPGKTPRAILKNYLNKEKSYNKEQMKKFMDIDERIESEVAE